MKEKNDMKVIIPKVGDWVSVLGFLNLGKVISLSKKKISFSVLFLTVKGVIQENSLLISEIEYIITDPEKIEFLDKELKLEKY